MPGERCSYPAFFMEKIRRKKAGKKEKFPINAVT
jgi:hypothetical protein